MAEKLTLRRLRQNRWIRELVREHRVSLEQLIQPLFIVEGLKEQQPILGLPDVYRETQMSVLKTVESDLKQGVRKFMLFFVPAQKGKRSFSTDFAENQIQSLRRHFGQEIFLWADVCLCSMTDHGHCGVLNESQDYVDNALSIHELKRLALHYAQAGVDGVAPSDMMDGRIGCLREALDEAGWDTVLLLSYAVKFHSQYYGPFRLAAEASPKRSGNVLKNRATYQIDPACSRDAWLCALRDEQEGADILMVKPGLPYLDILFQLSNVIHKPWCVYQVSGEYTSIELLARQDLMHAARAHLESWTAFIRAGASMIVTYGARKASHYFQEALE